MHLNILLYPGRYVRVNRKWIILTYISTFFFFAPIYFLQAQSPKPAHFQPLFEEICDTLETHFFDTTFLATQFPTLQQTYTEKLGQVNSYAEFSTLVNELLAQTNTSHTHYYLPTDPAYYYLNSIFSRSPLIQPFWGKQKVQFYSPGFWIKEINGKDFVYAVLGGGLAEQLGIMIGDEIIGMEVFPYAEPSLLPKKMNKLLENTLPTLEQTTSHYTLRVKHSLVGDTIPISFPLEAIHPNEEMMRALTASSRVYEVNGRRIAYVHIWSYAGENYHNAFLDIITQDSFRTADALVWDLRDGWGGAAPEYLNAFNPQIPTLVSFSTAEDTFVYNRQWQKPVVMLTNDGTRSGKEILAYGFKKHRMGPIVGENTAGAVTAGTLCTLSDGSIMYVASRDVLVDGERLEGIGVQPNITIPWDIRYAEGQDPQLETALKTAAELVN